MPTGLAVLVMSGRCPVLLITDDSTRPELAEAILHLRAKQRRCVIPSTAAEIGDSIDELLDAWTTAP